MIFDVFGSGDVYKPRSVVRWLRTVKFYAPVSVGLEGKTNQKSLPKVYQISPRNGRDKPLMAQAEFANQNLKICRIPLTSGSNDVKEWQARRESNPDLWYRKPLFYPLNYRPFERCRRLVEGDPKLKREFTRSFILRTKGSTKIFAYVFWGREPPGGACLSWRSVCCRNIIARTFVEPLCAPPT